MRERLAIVSVTLWKEGLLRQLSVPGTPAQRWYCTTEIGHDFNKQNNVRLDCAMLVSKVILLIFSEIRDCEVRKGVLN